jgi:hypothetical protein
VANERKQTDFIKYFEKSYIRKGKFFLNRRDRCLTEPVGAIELTDEELLFQTMAGETDLMAPNLGRLFFSSVLFKVSLQFHIIIVAVVIVIILQR